MTTETIPRYRIDLDTFVGEDGNAYAITARGMYAHGVRRVLSRLPADVAAAATVTLDDDERDPFWLASVRGAE